jgi:MSHA biogenesis protein MshO
MRRAIAGRHLGFTLVEAIVVIVITGIIAGMVAVFIRPAIDSYMDSARRATLTDIADTAARRMARELQGALPNSVRVDPTGQFLEFIPIRSAGRYRAEAGTAAVDDPLDFTIPDATFDVLGPAVTAEVRDSVVVYNLGIDGADAYEWPLSNRRLVTAAGAKVTLTPTANPLPFPSPGSRFQIVGTPVTYVCNGGNLLRYSGYPFPNPSTVTATTSFGAVVPAILATNVEACNFNYGSGPLQHNGLVSISLTLTLNSESVTLLHQVNVDNVP